jgi:hypothetical protein
MNSDEFAEMVEEVIVWYRELAQRARTPRVNLHLVLDGARIHSDDKLNDLADRYDEFHFVKLPTYSPDLNLAEFFFSTAKATTGKMYEPGCTYYCAAALSTTYRLRLCH